jgi:hypothetical protein
MVTSYSSTIIDLGSRWIASFNPGEIAAGAHWIGDCVGPRAGPGADLKNNINGAL